MDRRPAISVQSPRTENLSRPQKRFLERLVARLEAAGLSVVADSRPSAGIDERLKRMDRCQGVVVLAFEQWSAQRIRDKKRSVVLPSEFAHIGITLAVAARKPLLVLREKVVAERGALRRGYVHPVVSMPNSLDPDWLDSPEFEHELTEWRQNVDGYRHVFLGYSTQAGSVGDLVRTFLVEKLELRVFDWHEFQVGETIWDSIDRATRLTQVGIFLFMADDKVHVGERRLGAPRDNVVYEAGYFAGAKGRTRSLIIQETGAKVPSDLGGILYLSIDDRKSIRPIEAKLRENLSRMLAGGR